MSPAINEREVNTATPSAPSSPKSRAALEPGVSETVTVSLNARASIVIPLPSLEMDARTRELLPGAKLMALITSPMVSMR